MAANIITYGSDQIFNNANTNADSGGGKETIAFIDSTHFVQVYVNSGTSGHGTAVIGSISAGVITYGTPVEFSTASCSKVCVTVLDSTHFVVGYVGVSSRSLLIVGVMSGTTISSYGTEKIFSSLGFPLSIIALDSTHFVLSAYNNTNTVVTCCSVSTTTITLGSSVTANGGSITSCAICKIDTTHFGLAYVDGSGTGQGRLGSVSGTTITLGSANQYESNVNCNTTGIGLLDSTHLIIAYDTNTLANCVIATITGTTVSSYGTKYQFAAYGSLACANIAVLDSTDFVVIFDNTSNSNQGIGIVGNISAGVITYGTPVVFNTSNLGAGTSVAGITSSTFVLGFSDQVTIKGVNIIGTVVAPTVVNGNFLAFM